MIGLLCAWGPVASTAHAAKVEQQLEATDSGSGGGNARVVVRRLRRGVDGQLLVTVHGMSPGTSYEVTLDGVAIGTVTTNAHGNGRARFRNQPGASEQLLGADPTGKTVAVHTLDGNDAL